MQSTLLLMLLFCCVTAAAFIFTQIGDQSLSLAVAVVASVSARDVAVSASSEEVTWLTGGSC